MLWAAEGVASVAVQSEGDIVVAAVASEAVQSAADIVAVATPADIVVATAGIVVVTAIAVVTGAAMAGEASDSDLASAIPTTAATTVIHTLTDIHTTAAVIIQIHTTRILIRTARIPIATRNNNTRNSSISTDLSNNNSNNTVRSMARPRINGKAILRSRTAIRLKTGRSRIPPLLRRRTMPPPRRPKLTTTTSRTASGIALADPRLNRRVNRSWVTRFP